MKTEYKGRIYYVDYWINQYNKSFWVASWEEHTSMSMQSAEKALEYLHEEVEKYLNS